MREGIGDWDFCDNFMRGQQDCSKGLKPQHKDNEAYMRGYNAEWEWTMLKEEMKREQSKR